MNRGKLAINFLIIIALVFASCNNSELREKSSVEKLLSSPPFNTITDSIKEFPKEPFLFLERGVRLSQAGLHEIATADYRKAWDLSGDPEVAMELAANLFLINKIREAIAILDEGEKKFPTNTEFSRRLGEMYAELGENNRALAQYEKILQIDSANFETWYNKGSVLIRMRDTAGAIFALEKSFQLVPAYFSGLDLAQLYALTENPRALEICDFLLANDTSSQGARALFAKGIYYASTRQPDAAIKEFDEAIMRDWKYTDAYIEKGIIYYEKKSYDKALKVFKLAATVSNTDADTYFWIARVLEVKGMKNEAIENYERAIALDNSMMEARQRLRELTNP